MDLELQTFCHSHSFNSNNDRQFFFSFFLLFNINFETKCMSSFVELLDYTYKVKI